MAGARATDEAEPAPGQARKGWRDRAKDIAEDRTLTHPFLVPEAHAGMMVTPSVKLVRPLGEGGMGSVWVADHTALRTQVVVKFIASGLEGSKEAIDRFSREAAAASQVKSPHVVQTFDHGIRDDGVPYIVMELLEGQDLGHYLDAHGRCAPDLVVAIVAQLARALDRAHERGIVHRDIKPGNIFLCDQGNGEVFVKLLDFGIAKGVEVPLTDSATKTGAMIGSPFYMSPEQILGSKTIDHRSDLWSVGVVTYEALTGHKPFDAETMGGLAIRIHSEPLPVPSEVNDALSPAVDAWFQRGCSRSVPDRFGSAREMAEALAAALGGEMPRSAEMARVSTGSNVVSRTPALVAGATTEAGVVRSTTTSKTRNRLVAIAVFGLVVGLGTFVAVSALRKTDSRSTQGFPMVSDPSSAGAATAFGGPSMSTAKLAQPVVSASAPANVTEPPLGSAPATAPHAPAVSAAKPGHGSRPGAKAAPLPAPPSSSASPATLPSAAPATTKPASTGHDIF